MPDANRHQRHPASHSPLVPIRGPVNGPVPGKRESPALEMITDDGPALPIGITYTVGLVYHRKGSAKPFRLGSAR
jgi:hypothetical protein